MTRITRPCPTCYRTIPAYRTKCPWCGNGMGGARGALPAADRKSGIPFLAAVLILLAALGYVYYVKYIYPYANVPVNVGRYKHCPVSGENYDISVRVIEVPRMDAYKYGVRKINACPPEAVLMSEKPGLGTDGNNLLDAKLLKSDGKANTAGKIYPKMNRVAAWYAGRGFLALGMTKQQVFVAWGRPVEVESFNRDNRRIERWYFGDPVYNLPIMSRYADFDDGRLVHFSAGRPLPEHNQLKLVVR